MADIHVGKFINNLDTEDLTSEKLQGVVNNVYAKAISTHKKKQKEVEDRTKEQEDDTVTFVKSNHDRLKAHKNKPEKDIDKDDATAKDKTAKEINESFSLVDTATGDQFGPYETLGVAENKARQYGGRNTRGLAILDNGARKIYRIVDGKAVLAGNIPSSFVLGEGKKINEAPEGYDYDKLYTADEKSKLDLQKVTDKLKAKLEQIIEASNKRIEKFDRDAVKAWKKTHFNLDDLIDTDNTIAAYRNSNGSIYFEISSSIAEAGEPDAVIEEYGLLAYPFIAIGKNAAVTAFGVDGPYYSAEVDFNTNDVNELKQYLKELDTFEFGFMSILNQLMKQAYDRLDRCIKDAGYTMTEALESVDGEVEKKKQKMDKIAKRLDAMVAKNPDAEHTTAFKRLESEMESLSYEIEELKSGKPVTEGDCSSSKKECGTVKKFSGKKGGAESTQINENQDHPGREEFICAFRLGKHIIFEVRYYTLGSNAHASFTTAANEFNRPKSDWKRAGQAQEELLPRFPAAYNFWKKWDKYHFHDLTDEEYADLVKDIDKLKSTYKYTERVKDTYQNLPSRESHFRFDDLKKLAMNKLENESLTKETKNSRKKLKESHNLKRNVSNVGFATKELEKKGYSHEEANDLVLKIFDEHENDTTRPLEWYLDKILSKSDYNKEYGITECNKLQKKVNEDAYDDYFGDKGVDYLIGLVKDIAKKGDLKKYNLTQSEFYEIWEALKELKRNRSYDTVVDGVANFIGENSNLLLYPTENGTHIEVNNMYESKKVKGKKLEEAGWTDDDMAIHFVVTRFPKKNEWGSTITRKWKTMESAQKFADKEFPDDERIIIRQEEVYKKNPDLFSSSSPVLVRKEDKKWYTPKEAFKESKKLTEAEDGNITIETSTSILDMFYPSLYQTIDDYYIPDNEWSRVDDILVKTSMSFAEDAIKEVFPAATLKFKELIHPRAYNFSGENIIFDVTLPRADYERVKQEVAKNPKFAQFLKKNEPRSGYIPFGAYTIDKFKTQDDMYSIGQIVKFIADNDNMQYDFDEEFREEISDNFETYDYLWEEVMDWLREHNQAYQDFLTHFHADENSVIDLDSIIGWISDHDTLAQDFENRFGISLSESFTKSAKGRRIKESAPEESEGGAALSGFRSEELDDIFRVGAKFTLKKPMTLEVFIPDDWRYDWTEDGFTDKELEEIGRDFRQELEDSEQYDAKILDKYIVLDKIEGAKLELPAGFELTVAENIPNTQWFNGNPWFTEVVYDTKDGQIRQFYNSLPGPTFIAHNSQINKG